MLTLLKNGGMRKSGIVPPPIIASKSNAPRPAPCACASVRHAPAINIDSPLNANAIATNATHSMKGSAAAYPEWAVTAGVDDDDDDEATSTQ